MADDAFDQADHERFMADQFKPFLERFDAHLEVDDRRFEVMTVAMNRISTSMEVQVATQQAVLRQSVRRDKSLWTKLQTIGIWLAPMVMVGVFAAERWR